MSEQVRQPHAVMDLRSRELKAQKIERLLCLPPFAKTLHLLEVGTGAGGIANYFAKLSARDFHVVSVDVVDNRAVREGYEFVKVNSPRLPFEDNSFDVVISNHVIEHVGDSDAQVQHLCELRRVMRSDGCGYLAVPNRWMLVEPHYRLPFLSWLPRSLRSRWLQVFRGVSFYDCEPLSLSDLEAMLVESGWSYRNRCDEAVSVMAEIEPGRVGLIVYGRLPLWLRRILVPLMPTLIYQLSNGKMRA